ncbi:hypothetical protein [Adhaeribacter radiodurans]|uniref:Uncharacterized protein n=1 Tax=Adhaeribacter radiodurans TaxID=2745197 RepID=A0A7L7LA68_9BACT|nr:hypothetical protein [Adhaeribacter radiodurans]QMU29731.1 hypothetical protein HUW48_17620 [Adhaeribacter radiodurans]
MKEDFKLENLPKSNLYRVPDKYFEKLPGVIMERVNPGTLTTENNWLSSLWTTYRIAFTSVFLLISFVAAFLGAQNLSVINNSASGINLVNISRGDALEYVLLQDEVDSRDMAELSFTDADLSTDFTNLTPNDILETVDEQQLEEVYFN